MQRLLSAIVILISVVARADQCNAVVASAPKYRVLYFWSSVCPCVKACEAYSFIPLARKYHDRVSFEAIATNSYDLAMPRAELRKLIAAHHLPYPVLIDSSHSLALQYNAKVTPQTIVLDPSGQVVFDGMPDDTRRFTYDPPSPTKSNPHPVPDSFLAEALAQGLAGKPITIKPPVEAGCSIGW